MNKQPFYHELNNVTFTSTGINEDEFVHFLSKFFSSEEAQNFGIVKNSLFIGEYVDPTPGYPNDLL